MNLRSLHIILTLLFCVAVWGARYVNSMQFKQHCTGHLALAANAATITTVRAELGTAIRYLEANKMTTGNTSVLWQTPADDVGFWYRNLKSVHTQLAAVSDRAPALERSNVQLRVRQVLLHHGRHGDVVVVPDGLSRYPHNVVWAILCTLSVVLLLILIAPCLGDAADELDMVDLDYD